MAKKTVVTWVDDIDGSEGADTVEFGLDGLTYAIDLSKTNADALRQALRTYVDHARKVSRSRRLTADGASKAARQWAVAMGIDVPASGRVPNTIVAQWKAAGSPS